MTVSSLLTLAQPAEIFIADRYIEGLTLHGLDLFWKANCGDDFSPGLSYLRAIDAAAPGGGNRSGDVVARTLYQPAACGAERVASRNIAVDKQYVYWITGDSRVVQLPRSGTRETPRTLYTTIAANATGYYLAVSDDNLVWSTGTTIYRAPSAGGGSPQTIVDASRGLTGIRDLTAAGPQQVVFLDGRRPYLLTPTTPAATAFIAMPLRSPTEVGAFAVYGDEVFMANASRGPYRIVAMQLRDAAIRTVYTASGDGRAEQHVDQIAVDANNIYWHVVVDRAGGPIMRLPRLSTTAEPISEYLLISQTNRLQSSGNSLFWVSNDGIHRLPTGAPITMPTTPDIVPFTVTDVSPDRPFGSRGTDYPPYGSDPAGKVTSITVDPNDASVVYAASERAGVWKSTDGAHTWTQSSRGIRNGRSQAVPAIAIDARNSQRVLYSTSDDDFRPGNLYGGLYRSTNAGGSWEHVPLPGCHPDPGIGGVHFGAGRAQVWTRCGIFWSDDLVSWAMSPAPPGLTSFNGVAVSGRTVFVCADTRVFRSVDAGLTWGTAPLAIPGGCNYLSAAPTGSEPEPAVLALYTVESNFEVALVDFATPGVRDLRFHRPYDGSGAAVVFAARRPGTSLAIAGPDAAFDVFAADGAYFFQLAGDSWARIEPVHWDTWMMAFPPNYDPQRGNCRAYVASDGGVFASLGEGGRAEPGCVAARQRWVRAQSGLHAFGSYHVGGDMPTLFLTSGDNGTWVTTSAGIPGSSWKLMDNGCCGDTGLLLADPALPSRVMSGRNGFRVDYEVPPGASWPRSGNNLYQDAMPDGTDPGLTAQVLTPPGVAPPANADYVSAVTRPGEVFDHIIRNRTRDAGGWQTLSTGEFSAGTVVRVAVSGGHEFPTVYVLTRDGRIRRGVVDASGRIGSWRLISTGLTAAQNMFVNPYRPGVLYVTDSGMVKSTIDDGDGWRPEPDLLRIATNNGEFRAGCADAYCSLQDLLFLRDNPRVIIAVMWPGGIAWSPDAGVRWIPITERLRGDGGLSSVRSFADLVARPYSAFFDPAGGGRGEGALYVAMRGRGLIRIDGPFSRLERRSF